MSNGQPNPDLFGFLLKLKIMLHEYIFLSCRITWLCKIWENRNIHNNHWGIFEIYSNETFLVCWKRVFNQSGHILWKINFRSFDFEYYIQCSSVIITAFSRTIKDIRFVKWARTTILGNCFRRPNKKIDNIYMYIYRSYF